MTFIKSIVFTFRELKYLHFYTYGFFPILFYSLFSLIFLYSFSPKKLLLLQIIYFFLGVYTLFFVQNKLFKVVTFREMQYHKEKFNFLDKYMQNKNKFLDYLIFLLAIVLILFAIYSLTLINNYFFVVFFIVLVLIYALNISWFFKEIKINKQTIMLAFFNLLIISISYFLSYFNFVFLPIIIPLLLIFNFFYIYENKI